MYYQYCLWVDECIIDYSNLYTDKNDCERDANEAAEEAEKERGELVQYDVHELDLI